MAGSSEQPSAQEEIDSLQDRVIRELDELSERIDAVIGKFIRPRLDEDIVDTPADTQERSDPSDFHRKAA
ncbi:MAG: hypothetical protein MPJ50_18545 [Pirellulales bacterium]|nr:hypothetical protein [Pirellulales bacterium]